MDLATLSERHGGFFVPAFVVTVGGADLTQQLAIGVSQVEVDLALGGMGRFSFTVVNTFDAEQREFLAGDGRKVLDILTFGAQVEVKVGYGDRAGLTTMLAGVITEITTSFAESGSPELSVSGYDHLFPMTLGKQSRSWSQLADSDVVDRFAREYNLDADVVPTRQKHAQIEQNQESDFELMQKLATRNHFEFYVRAPKTLRFGPPRDRDEGVVSLIWGEGLLSFKPEANLATQVTTVEVYGWDPQQKKAIVGKATAPETSGLDPRRTSAGERLRVAVGKPPVLQVRQPVFTEAEAKRRATAILNDHAKNFVTGDAECLGLPDILPDRNVTLGGLGELFSKTYYVHQATHKVDTSGYRTRIKVKETSL